MISIDRMKIIHSLGWFFPDSVGGTEVYVDGLIQELNKLQKPIIHNVIAAALTGYEDNFYDYKGVPVYRYPVYPNLNLQQIRGRTPPGGIEYFTKWLQTQQAQIYHQHTWATSCGIHHLLEARKAGLATIVTVHVPGNICLRGTMLLDGDKPCDGHIEQIRCSTCWGISRGMTSQLANFCAQIPLYLSDLAEFSFYQTRFMSAFATRSLVKAHQERLSEMSKLADRIVAVCQWLYDALLLNGVPQEKLVLSRQGAHSEIPPNLHSPEHHDGILHIGFLGRWDPIKGIHILVEAIQRLPKLIPVKLTIHGLTQGKDGQQYRQQVLQLAAGDPRIHFAEPLPREGILPALVTFDLLAVPSQWLETGPIVVLEAQAVGTPVLGSNLGGIAELVKHGVDGWLVSANDIEAWGTAILYLATNRKVLTKLKQNIQPVRTMKDAATEMANLYAEILVT